MTLTEEIRALVSEMRVAVLEQDWGIRKTREMMNNHIQQWAKRLADLIERNA